MTEGVSIIVIRVSIQRYTYVQRSNFIEPGKEEEKKGGGIDRTMEKENSRLMEVAWKGREIEAWKDDF